MQFIDAAYRDHAKAVFRYLLSLTHDENLSEELTQETFYQAVRCSSKYDGSCKVLTWLCAIAKNQLYVYYRKHPKTEELIEQFEIQSPESDVISEISHIELLKQLHLLNEPVREIIYLRIFGDASFKEIGEVFDKSENWARVTFYRGKEKLKKELIIDG